MNALGEIIVTIRVPTAELLRLVLEHESVASLSVQSAPALLPAAAPPPKLLPARTSVRAARARSQAKARTKAKTGTEKPGVTRPSVINCENEQCGKPHTVAKSGPVPRFCSPSCKSRGARAQRNNRRRAAPRPEPAADPRRPADPLTSVVAAQPDHFESALRRRGESMLLKDEPSFPAPTQLFSNGSRRKWIRPEVEEWVRGRPRVFGCAKERGL